MDDKLSLFANVDSDIPQSTVLGLSLVIFYINDLPLVANSEVYVFDDDCLI